jgi:hypothetical protein
MTLPKNSGDIQWTKKTKKVKGKTKVAVLISIGYGAGWSTWNTNFSSFLLFDKGIVERVLRNDKDEIPDYIKDKTGDEHLFLDGLKDLIVVWVDEGVKFVVNEYDGSESITQFENLDYFTA